MAYFILQNRRLPKQVVSCFKFQEGTVNTSPYLSIKIRGKEEIIPFKDNIEMVLVKEHLIATFPDFVKVGNSYIRKTVFRDLIFLNLKKKQRIEWNQVKSQVVCIIKQ